MVGRTRGTLFILLGFGLLTAGALAGCATYTAKPLDPAQVQAEFAARDLAQPFRLRERTPPQTWDLASLTLVALHYHADIAVARAKLQSAEAAVVTAGQRPNPTLAWSPQYALNADPGQSPWTVGLDFDIPIETAGKRGHRVEAASALGDSARLELAQTAWNVRQRLRAALVEHVTAVDDLHAAEAEQRARAQLLKFIDARLAAGEASQTDRRPLQIDAAKAQVELETARGRVESTRLAMAAALAVPPAALVNIRLDKAAIVRLAPAEQTDARAIRAAGVLNRLDIRRALADYAAAEAGLQLEIAKQYPDLHLGPGYQFDQGQDKLTIGVSAELPLLNQNQGPIAEAEARRAEAGARLLAVQADALSAVEQALSGYRAALAELAQAQRLATAADARLQDTQRLLKAGEADAVAVAIDRAALESVRRLRVEATRKALAGLTALEDAVQRPLDGSAPPVVPPTPSSAEAHTPNPEEPKP